MTRSLNTTAVRGYRPIQEQSARTLVRLLWESPQDFIKHIRLTVGSAVVNISYGYDVKINDREYIDCAEHAHEVFGLTAKPYAFLVDLLPFRMFIHAPFLSGC